MPEESEPIAVSDESARRFVMPCSVSPAHSVGTSISSVPCLFPFNASVTCSAVPLEEMAGSNLHVRTLAGPPLPETSAGKRHSLKPGNVETAKRIANVTRSRKRM